MLQVGVPGGPELLIVFILLAIAAFGLLAVLVVVGVIVYLVLRSGSEPDESGRVGGEADREPLDSGREAPGNTGEATDNAGESVDGSIGSVDSRRSRDR